MSMLVWLFAAVVVFGGIGVAVAIFVAASRSKGAPSISSMPAQVLGAREVGAGSGVQHWVRLRLRDGRELDLQVTAGQARVMYPGQAGTANIAGERLIGWQPELAGGPQDSHSSE
ncbi:MAG: hypothetical protein ACOX61_08245 [Brooklawnia sp.]|jgi:hypothetical protein